MEVMSENLQFLDIFVKILLKSDFSKKNVALKTNNKKRITQSIST